MGMGGRWSGAQWFWKGVAGVRSIHSPSKAATVHDEQPRGRFLHAFPGNSPTPLPVPSRLDSGTPHLSTSAHCLTAAVIWGHVHMPGWANRALLSCLVLCPHGAMPTLPRTEGTSPASFCLLQELPVGATLSPLPS